MKKILLVLAVLTSGALLAFSGTASAKKGYKTVPSSASHYNNLNAKQAKRTKWRTPSRFKGKYKVQDPCRRPNPPVWCKDHEVFEKGRAYTTWPGGNAP
jgi:uncharacterized protein YceK